MKKIILLFGLMISLGIKAQDNQDLDTKIEEITQRIDSFVQAKNTELKQAIEQINNQLKEQKISKEDAESKKEELAKKYAEDIDYAIFKLTSQIKDVAQRKEVVRKVVIKNNDKELTYTIRLLKNKHKNKKYTKHIKRTESEWNINFGLNNVLSGNNLENINDSPYAIAHSRYFSFGIEWKTSLSKNKNSPYFTYGANLVWNTFKPKNEVIHRVVNDELVFQPLPLKYSKLRTRWLQVPVGFEIHLPNKNFGYLKLKAGGYAKINIVSKQKYQYSVNNKDEVVEKGNFNINHFNYGWFTEVGGTDWSIILNYDLLNFYQSKNWKHFSLGLKLEL